MSDTGLSLETRTTLDGVSVATPATALFHLGLRHQVIQDVCPAHLASELDFVQNRPRPHVHVQKISYVAISSRACSREKMIPPKSPPSRYWLLYRMRDCGSRCSLNSSRLMT